MATNREEAFMLLTEEVRRSFHSFAASADALHEADGIGAGHRAVLESLSRSGELTVPALARARPVSRQHIQALVNDLLARQLVESVPNPAHRRSPLIRLSTRGKARFEAMREREREWLAVARLPATLAELQAAAATLRRLREHLARIEQ